LFDPYILCCFKDWVFSIASSSAFDLVNNTMIIERTASPIIMTIGIGSSNSLAKGAPIVKDFETSTIMLIAKPFFANGKTRSS